MILKEFDYITYYEDERDEDKERNSLPKQEFENLKKFILENEKINATQFLRLTTRNNKEALKVQNFVGIIQLKNGITLEILPKITNLETNTTETKKILIKMLKTLKNSPFQTFQLADLKTAKMPLFEVFIQMFLDELAVLVRKGIKSDYINITENQNFLKGKLKINDHLKYNYIHKEKFYVSYDEYLPDRIENKIIKTALQKVNKISKNFSTKQRIRMFMFVFDKIKPLINYRNIFKNLTIDRTINYYETTLLWCKTFLLEESFTPYSGKNVAFALLFDMNKLFESYVGNWIKKSCKNSVKLQDACNYLIDTPKKFKLIPDIVINDGEKILDTKWKLLDMEKNNQNISQSDMYQMFAYATKYVNCKKVYLIYPYVRNVKLSEYQTKICKDKEVKIKPLFFDLDKKELKDDSGQIYYPEFIYC